MEDLLHFSILQFVKNYCLEISFHLTIEVLQEHLSFLSMISFSKVSKSLSHCISLMYTFEVRFWEVNSIWWAVVQGYSDLNFLSAVTAFEFRIIRRRQILKLVNFNVRSGPTVTVFEKIKWRVKIEKFFKSNREYLQSTVKWLDFIVHMAHTSNKIK